MSFRNRSPLHVVLVGPEIHWNTGSVGRTCLATGAQLHLVEPLGFSLEDKQVRRAGLDYWPRVQPKVWRAWESLEPSLESLGSPWFFSSEGRKPYWDVDMLGPTCLVFGAETKGLPPEVRERYRQRCVSLPMAPGTVRSLNLANSVAIAVYEALRQRSESGGP